MSTRILKFDFNMPPSQRKEHENKLKQFPFKLLVHFPITYFRYRRDGDMI